MKLQVRSEDTAVFYPLATWTWKPKEQILIQRIPKIKEVRISIPGKTHTPSLDIPQHLLRPSLQTGQEIRLDEIIYYVAYIEMGDLSNGMIVFTYTLSQLPPAVPAFWSVDVSEE
ncbi:MAG: hypothetical protein PHO67_07770 [Candidatus Omnitrophica bacterium]|nr:hypothetical protein [Candidatus Omnitrophota bacterium]